MTKQPGQRIGRAISKASQALCRMRAVGRRCCRPHTDFIRCRGGSDWCSRQRILESKIMSSPSIVHSCRLTRRSALGIIGFALVMPSGSAFAQTSAILVHKDPGCGCCVGWVRHLEDAGFAVTAEETADLEVVRKRLGVPADLAACHTAEIAGYVIEGHVPASAIRRLLKERPDATGLAVPGMPAGSPGMEGRTPQRYNVVLFGATGRRPYMYFVGTENVG